MESEEGIVLSEGRVKLLKLIDETGSLNQAAKAMGLSYQKAWRLVDESNKTAASPLVTTQIGGKRGGGTVLTPYGKSLIASFEEINRLCWIFLDEQEKKHDL
ncbi:MAG: winged helix-turn-helix domain-containing protein [Flavobacterium sp.]